MLRSFRRGAMFALLVLPLFACDGGPTEPRNTRTEGISLVAGHSLTDTAWAVPVQALVVEVRGKDGKVVRSGTVVRFQALTRSYDAEPGDDYLVPTMAVAGLASEYFDGVVTDTTDAKGRVTVRTKFGASAGDGAIVVTVPTLGLQDTARYTVQPGAAFTLLTAPRDSAVYVGGSYKLRAAVVDQHGNPRNDPVSYTANAPEITVADGAVRGARIGRGYVLARAGSRVDTAWVSVVPQGTLATVRTDNGRLVTFELDGSSYRELTEQPSWAPNWSPSGEEIIFDTRYGTPPAIYSSDLTGKLSSIFQPNPAGEVSWPRYSPDGEWVYFSAQVEYRWAMFRVRLDGTELQNLSGDRGDGWVEDINPSPAGTGDRIVYVHVEGAYDLYIRALGTGAATPLGVRGSNPQWIGASEWIAFNMGEGGSEGPLALIRSDGSQQRIVSAPGRSYDFGFGLSPDGEWLVARASDTGTLELINLNSGVSLPLGYSGSLQHPAWRP